MIFKLGVLVDWKKANAEDSTEEARIAREIKALRYEYFDKDKKGFCQLRYPNGIRKKNQSGHYEPKKNFLLDLKSVDGVWRWSDRLPSDGKFSYANGNHFKVTDPWLFYEKDVELIWFLKNHCPQVLSKKVYFEDFEAVAEKEAKSLMADVDLKYIIYSPKSPVGNDIALMRTVADIFNVKDVGKLTKHELKNALFHTVIEGETKGSTYVNIKRFEELTDNAAKLKAANIAKKSINSGEIKYKSSDKTWYSYAGGEYLEPLLKLTPMQVPEKESVFIDKVVNDRIFRGTVYAELGINSFTTKAEVEELGYQPLLKKCKDEGIPTEKTDKLEDLVRKFAERFNIES